ncbi:MAG: DegT/DnrJ/EryC1/StrS aminotransferase family protein [Fibromonadaceae bacterium]|jgi:perosamine synthetase|nr:DegT/DnrJ/EryC1/StrS aminotransferase family protein [Fibromonadaceae bacterium]
MSNLSQIFYTKPSITQKEIDYATDAATNGWGARCYEYITRFENLLKEHLGVNYAIATSSCTGAMHMGLSALGIGLGDEVIIADINWIAPAAAVTYLGAKVVLVDILPNTWCIDPSHVEKAITKNTKAIIAVHLYGNLCNMNELLSIGIKYNIPIIEDAAEAVGSIYKGKRAGSMGAFGVFSFHGTKTITTGEGGIFVTQDAELHEKVLTLSNHGRSRAQYKQFWFDEVGFKYKMSNIQAAIGCAQMERIDELISKKRIIFKWYEKKLKGLLLSLNPEPLDCQNGYWMVTIVVDKNISFDRDLLLQEFKNNNIDGRVFFWPLSLVRKDDERFVKAGENSVSYDLYNRSVNLPCYNDITEEEVDRVVACIKRIIDQK